MYPVRLLPNCRRSGFQTLCKLSVGGLLDDNTIIALRNYGKEWQVFLLQTSMSVCLLLSKITSQII